MPFRATSETEDQLPGGYHSAVELDVDQRAANLSNLLRTIASGLPLYVVGVLDENKKAGELFAECPFHVVATKQSAGILTHKREMTLYVSLRDATWRCVRCAATGDATRFVALMDIIKTEGWKGPELGALWQSAMEDIEEKQATREGKSG